MLKALRQELSFNLQSLRHMPSLLELCLKAGSEPTMENKVLLVKKLRSINPELYDEIVARRLRQIKIMRAFAGFVTDIYDIEIAASTAIIAAAKEAA